METKFCRRCKQDKSVSSFSKGKKEKDGLQAWCKQCAADYFQANRDKVIIQIRERTKRVRLEAQQLIWDYLLNNPCVDCGESDPMVLDFDHVRGEKTANVSQLISSNGNGPRLWEEVAKCDVRCANCHRRKTAKDLGWYSFLDQVI